MVCSEKFRISPLSSVHVVCKHSLEKRFIMADNGGAVVQGQAVEGGGGEGQQAAGAGGGRTGWQVLRSILFQMVIFYFITSFFRGRQQPPPQPTDVGGRHPAAGGNLFPKGQEMVMVGIISNI